MSEGVGNLAQSLIEGRRLRMQQNQQDIQNAESGIYRGQAPTGTMTVNTPDYQITDTPGGDGPQVQQVGGYSATNSGSRPLPGGISALGPMTGSGQPQQTPGPVSTSFSGPDGRGVVDGTRYQQIATNSGQQYYMDREQTPDAQALRRSVLTGEMGFNRALQVQMLRNSGMLNNTDERNKGLAYRTDATNASYGPGGARYEGAVGKEQQMYGYVDDAGQYHPGSVPTGRIYTAAGEVPSKIAVNAARPHYPSSRGFGSGASDPTTRQFNAVGKQVTQANTAINQTTRQLNAPATMLDSSATSSLQRQLVNQQHKRDSLEAVGDSLSGVMQHSSQVSPSGSSTAPHVPRSGNEATMLPLPTPGAHTPMDGNRTDQTVRTTNDRIPSGPTDATSANNGGTYITEAGMYQNAVKAIQALPGISASEKSARLATLRDRYNQRVAAVGKPTP